MSTYRTLKTQTLSFLFAVTGHVLMGQWSPSADTPTVLPQSPSATTPVTVITRATTSTMGLKVSSSFSVNQGANSINVQGCYSNSMLTALKTYVDTFLIGTLQPGVYAVNFTATESSTATACIPVSTNSSSVSFTVSGVSTGIPQRQLTGDLTIFPNPVRDKLFFDPEVSFQRVELYSSTGLLIKRVELGTGKDADLGFLSDGIYFVQARSGQEILRARFVKIN